MTKKEERERLGEATAEYSETKRHVQLLEKELRDAGLKLESLPLFLRRADSNRVVEVLAAVDFGKLKATAERLVEANQRLDELKDVLRAYNVEL